MKPKNDLKKSVLDINFLGGTENMLSIEFALLGPLLLTIPVRVDIFTEFIQLVLAVFL